MLNPRLVDLVAVGPASIKPDRRLVDETRRRERTVMRLRITDAGRAAIGKRALDKIPASLASSPGVTAAHEGGVPQCLCWSGSCPSRS
jgi:hypothetical protein